MGANNPTGFGSVTYKGSGIDEDAGGMFVGGIGFAPDLVWIKRTDGTADHSIYDTIRGVNQKLKSNTVDAEYDDNNTVIRFDEDGFTVADDDATGANGDKYVAWCRNMGGTSVANTSGSINSTVRANTTYGQSIVSYTGTGSNATVGHGLSGAPEMIIVKRRSDADSWVVYHASNTAAPETDALILNSNSATSDSALYWNDTAPTSSLFTIGTHSQVNGSSQTYIAYCFDSVSGYSKFGTYTGDGTTNGSKTVTLGFRPAWVMIKCTNDSENWLIWDNVRNPFTATQNRLFADTGAAETTNVATGADNIEFTSTGFKMTGLGGGSNQNNNTYIYAAFAGGADAVSTYNTAGTIDSRVKANTTYGQSIVKYKRSDGGDGAATIGHGLSAAPNMIIKKYYGDTNYWYVYHSSLTSGHELYLNETNASTAGSSMGVSGTNLISFTGTDSGQATVAYCFHDVTGYSKFGSYTGNGSATGPSVTTGFKPAWLLIKRTADEGWQIVDSTRNPNNTLTTSLSPNSSAAERDDLVDVDFTSTGFQLKGTDSSCNASGSTYIYAAFADKREYAYWLDQSGNNNDWTSNNLTESDISVDTPTNNFATFNAIADDTTGATTEVFSEGNLKVGESGTGWSNIFGTMGMPSGKYYWESYMSGSGTTDCNVGVVQSNWYRGSNGGIDTTDAYSLYAASSGVGHRYI